MCNGFATALCTKNVLLTVINNWAGDWESGILESVFYYLVKLVCDISCNVSWLDGQNKPFLRGNIA